MPHADFFTEAHQPNNQPWFVERLLRASSLALIAAAPNSLKTWAALDLARAAVCGGAWMGRSVVAPTPVMLVSLDSALGDVGSQFRRLTQEFADSGPAARAHVSDLIFRYKVSPGAFDLARLEHVEKLISTANSFKHKARSWPGGEMSEQSKAAVEGADGFFRITKETGETLSVTDDETGEVEEVRRTTRELDPAHFGVGLIIIDALSTSASSDQNSAEDMGYVMSQLRRIADRTRALVLVLHHNRKIVPGQKDRDINAVRGSGVITAVPETVLLFEVSSTDTSVVEVTVAKQRGPRDPSWRFVLDRSGDPDADNRHTVAKHNEYQRELDAYESNPEREQCDPLADARPRWTPERLYPAPHPYARASLFVLQGASAQVEKLLRFVISRGGSTSLDEAVSWALTSGDFAFEQDDEKGRNKAAKKWVTSRASEARAQGWLKPATEGTRGNYEISARGERTYGSTDIGGAFTDYASSATNGTAKATIEPDHE